jgi:hypothetical protein
MLRIAINLPRPHGAQAIVLRSRARWRIVRAGRRFGKSIIALLAGIDELLKGHKVAYVAPTYKMAKKFFNAYLQKLPKEVIVSANRADLQITLITGGSIDFFSGEAIDNMRGSKYHFVIVDEAAFVKDFESAWLEVIRPTLTDYKGRALFISTPRGRNYFYALGQRGADSDPRYSEYQEFYFTSYDNPHIDASEIDAAKTELPEEIFNQEYLALASENAANPFGTKYIDLNIQTDQSFEPAVIYGIDVAKMGDSTCIYGIDRFGRWCYFDTFRGPWHETKRKILALPEDIPKVIDRTSAGDVVYEDLEIAGCMNLYGHVFTNANKTQMVYELVLDVQTADIGYNEHTAQQMHTYEYMYNAKTGVLTFNAQSGYFDDDISALMLANTYRKKIVYTGLGISII